MRDDPVHILLVEDEDAHVEIIRRAFEHAGDTTVLKVVATLAEARIYLESASPLPDLIIADWRLPDGEGLELLAVVPALKDIPAVIMTSHGSERVAVEALKTGALDYVVKTETTLHDMPHIARRALRQWQNIVERKRAEAALRESEERYRLITENATDIISLVDQEGHFVYLSPSVQQALGYAPVALIGNTLFTYIHPQDLTQVHEHWTYLMIQGQMQVTYRCRHRDGSWRWLDTQGTLFEQEGIYYAVIVGRDITERRRLEEQLFQAQKLEAIGQLAGGVAHDFNNLLVVISGCAELALAALAPDDPVRADLHEIQKAARRATGLTRQLLTFARRQISEPQVLNLNDLILDMNKMLQRLIREDITFVTLPAADLWSVWADPGQIEQVIVNLAVNARDAMPQGGRLTIETANVIISAENAPRGALKPGPYVLLAVTDTGVGMSEEVQRHAFEPFFTTKGPGQGTGLGLATCYGIVKQHGGAIYLYSEIGRGTIVKIYLPQAQETAMAQLQRPDEEPLPRGVETVLLVEDEAAVRALAARVLRGQGYTVLEAADGLEALKIATSHTGPAISMLLTDLVVPHIGGFDLALQLRELLPSLRVLLMSGYTDHTIVSSGLLAQSNAFIQKPFSTAALVRKVREVLDS